MAQKRISSALMKKTNTKPAYIASRVIELRKKFGFSQKEIAKELGVTSQAVYQAEKINGALLFEVIIFLSIKFNVNPAWVILENNKKIPQILTNEDQVKSNTLSIVELAKKIKSDSALLAVMVGEKETSKKKK